MLGVNTRGGSHCRIEISKQMGGQFLGLSLEASEGGPVGFCMIVNLTFTPPNVKGNLKSNGCKHFGLPKCFSFFTLVTKIFFALRHVDPIDFNTF